MAKLAKKINPRAPGKTSPSLASAWSPLRQSLFRALWIASVVSNIGSWMQDVGEGLPLTWRYRLVGKKNLSLTPSMHWPEPVMMIDTDAKEGPAITSIEYRIDPKSAEEFLQAMKEMKRIRQRDGAIRWHLLRDSADPQGYVEIFVTESWAEHLRQHERITAEDREAERHAQAFHVGAQPPKVTHLIAEQLPD